MVSIVHVQSGLTLYTKIFDEFCNDIDNEGNSELIGSFLTALKAFSQQFGQDKIRQIDMNTIKFLIYEKDGLLIFFVLDEDDKIKSYKKSLRMSLKAFQEVFSRAISHNYNEITQFSEFNPILQEILKVPPEKIEYSCLECPMGKKNNCLFKKVKDQILEFKGLELIKQQYADKNKDIKQIT
jgi:hypothetical protein